MTNKQAYYYLRLCGIKEPTLKQIAKLVLLGKVSYGG